VDNPWSSLLRTVASMCDGSLYAGDHTVTRGVIGASAHANAAEFARSSATQSG